MVFHDGKVYRLADGHHRVEAARRAGMPSLPARIYSGDESQALLYAAGANHDNGVRRTRADTRLAIQAVLRHPAWASRSSHWIAEVVGVTNKSVDSVRKGLERTGEIPHCSKRTARDGRQLPACGTQHAQPETLSSDGHGWPQGSTPRLHLDPAQARELAHDFERLVATPPLAEDLETVLELLEAHGTLVEQTRQRLSAGALGEVVEAAA